jgi:3'-phosphoadenosine 5'-phosphosulfate (PAPS) 3'-phosphatase
VSHRYMTTLSQQHFGDLDSKLRVSIDAAYKAGKVAQTFCLNRVDNTSINIQNKLDLSPVTIVDQQLNEMIVQRLQDAFPDARVIGEESDFSKITDVGIGQVFFVDPIDGTRL